MEFKYDEQADAIYISLSYKPYAYGMDLDDERRVDYDADNMPIGVELLCVSAGVNLDGLPFADEIAGVLEANGVETYKLTKREGYSGTVFDVNLISPSTSDTAEPTIDLKKKEEVEVTA